MLQPHSGMRPDQQPARVRRTAVFNMRYPMRSPLFARVADRTRAFPVRSVGEGCSALRRGRAAMHSPHVERLFEGTVGCLGTLTSDDELDPLHLNRQLLQLCKGAESAEVI